MNFETYQSIKAINFSTLKSMRKSPKQFKYNLEHGYSDSVGKTLGRAAHCAILEPDKFATEFAIYKGKIRKGADWEKFKAVHGEESIIKKDEYEKTIQLRDAVRNNPVASRYLSGGKPEHVIQWVDRVTGLSCKARLDYFNEIDGELVIVDLKGCVDVRLSAFQRECARGFYHGQLAFYQEGIATVYGKVPKCVIVAVEHVAPHDVAVYKMGEAELEAGYSDVSDFLQQVATCQANNSWPGCYDAEQDLVLRKWDLGIPDESPEEIGLDMEGTTDG